MELPVALPPKQRLFAHPARPNAKVAGGSDQLTLGDADPMILDGRRLNPRDYTPKPLKRGARVSAGTILGRIGRVGPKNAPHVLFEPILGSTEAG